jgi:hypothetical protein
MATRRTAPTIHTLDRALQETQRELQALRAQLNPQATSPPRQGPRGSGRRFASSGRGRLQARAAIRQQDFLEQQSSNRYVISCVERLEITEAFWYPDDDQALPAVGYSFIRIYEHDPACGQLVTDGRLLGEIEGRPKTVGEQATGPLCRGACYRFRLEEQAIAEKCTVVALDTEATLAVAQWPPGSIIICYRWLD